MKQILALITTFLLAVTAVLNAAGKKNVVFIICDDLNHSVHGFGGHPQACTPKLDKISESDVLLPWTKDGKGTSDDLADIAPQLNSGTGRKHFKVLQAAAAKYEGGLEKMLKDYTVSYLAAVNAVDVQVGKVLDTLERTRRLDDPLIVLTSDHGFHFGDKENFFKYTLREKATRVPFIVCDPSKEFEATRGQICDIPIKVPLHKEQCRLSGCNDLYPNKKASALPMTGTPQASRKQETAALIFQSPLDYQVFQRRTVDEGSIPIRGSAGVAVDEWQCRVSESGGDSAKAEWQSFKSTTSGSSLSFDVKTKPNANWYRVEVRGVTGGKTVAEAAVDHVGVGEVFIVAGQSNAANHGSEKQVTKTQQVSSFDGKQWSIANDPQRGASGHGGSFMPAFGDAMATRYHVPIGLVPIAVGSTSVREWLPKGVRFKQNTTTGKGTVPNGGEFESSGVLFDKLCQPMQALGIGGFRAVIWHQGESDAGQAREGHPADRQISGAQYVEFMEKLIRTSRNRAAWPVPWFTAVTTYHREQDAEDTEFRSAMKSLWSKGLSWEGPDTDTLRANLRAGVHFNGPGLEKHGGMWAEKIGAWLDDQLAPPRDGPPSPDYQLVWRDEFDGTELDATKWRHRSLGPRNGAFISADCSQLDGQGHLVITAKKVGDQFHGGMIATDKTQLWTRGYFECRLKVATEPGMNTAFWLQGDHVADPDRGKATPDDTLHNGTEIDILEYIARQGEVAHFNLHWNGYGKTHRSMPSDAFVPGLREGFHTYGVEWTGTGYTFFIDGRRVWQSAEAISGAPEYLILDLEISKWAGGIETAKLPASAVFDWVRVWQRK